MAPNGDSYLIFLAWQSLVLMEEGKGSQTGGGEWGVKCFVPFQKVQK